MIVILFITNILLCGVLAVLQLSILGEMGLIHQRIAERGGGIDQDIKSLLGKMPGLPPMSISLFASLSCSSCAVILRGLGQENLADKLSVYIVDRDTNQEAIEARNLFPEYKFNVLGGQELFSEMGAKIIPLIIKTDKDGIISDIKQVVTEQQLKEAVL